MKPERKDSFFHFPRSYSDNIITWYERASAESADLRLDWLIKLHQIGFELKGANGLL